MLRLIALALRQGASSAALLVGVSSASATTLDSVRLVRWSMMAMLEAEEYGVTSANASVRRLPRKTGDLGKLMGLDNAWAFNIIRQVGDYSESSERNVGQDSGLKLERGPNALWNKGGLVYPIPFR